MPRWKAAVQASETFEAEERAAEAEKADREWTFKVVAERARAHARPDANSEVLLRLVKGECVTGTAAEIGGARWLKLGRGTLESHPDTGHLAQGTSAWVLISDGAQASVESGGQGPRLVRAPAELGWRSQGEAIKRSEVFEVTSEGGVAVVAEATKSAADSLDGEATDILLPGALIKVVASDAERKLMQFELMSGEGPASGWIPSSSEGVHLSRVSIGDAGAEKQKLGQQLAQQPQDSPEASQDTARADEAMRCYGERFMRSEAQKGSFEVFPWRCNAMDAARAQRDEDEDEGEEELEEAEGGAECQARKMLECDLATTSKTANADEEDFGEELAVDRRHRCDRCGLPLVDAFCETRPAHARRAVYERPPSETRRTMSWRLLHKECMAQALLQEEEREAKAAMEKERRRKQKRREEYGIGWSPEKIPLNVGPMRSLTGWAAPHGPCALAVAPNNRVTLVPTISPAAAVNLEYLSIALRVRKEEDREPLFSLDPVDPDEQHTMQVKRFEPYWLKGTSVGDVLFESDYHLKELSMGEYDQPVVGMSSCMDEVQDEAWSAREWFVVRKADVVMSTDGVLVPVCKMGVEAREQVLNKDGHLEDVRVTRPDHPLVKYAEKFTLFFDLIAERKSVIYHLRELAKASILAKYLLNSNASLESDWFELYTPRKEPCILEIPQLWNERWSAVVTVGSGGDALHLGGDELQVNRSSRAIYGGVQFGLNRFRMGARGMVGAVQTHLQGPGAAITARRGFFAPTRLGARGMAMPRVTPTGVGGAQPRGVDLGLGKFALDQTQVAEHLGAVAWGNDVRGCAAFGGKFWEELDGTSSSVFTKEQQDLLQRIFNPQLSDRRAEGDHFQPPDGEFGYMNRLRCLLGVEDEVRRRRKRLFLSRRFSTTDAGPLFPSWAAEVTSRSGEPKAQDEPAGKLQARKDYLAEASMLKDVLRAATPAFDKRTEDGLSFRIYRLGSLEVRTTQELGQSEVVGMVFCRREEESTRSPSRRRERASDSEEVAKVAEYVEVVRGKRGGEACRFFVVMETTQGCRVVSELLPTGKVAWSADPRDLDDRISLAKVLRSVSTGDPSGEGSRVTLGELRKVAGSLVESAMPKATLAGSRRSGRVRQAYAVSLFLRVAGEAALDMEIADDEPHAAQGAAARRRRAPAASLAAC